MADLIFPPSPSTGDEFTGTFGEVYTWDGEKWTLTAGGTGSLPPPAAVGPTPPASPGTGDLWFNTNNNTLNVWNGTAWVPVSPTTPVSLSGTTTSAVFFFPGKPAASQIIRVPIAVPINIAALFAGSQSSVGTNPTAAAAFNVLVNGSSVGTATVSTAGAVTWTGSALAVTAGQVLEMQAPATQDSTLADVAFTILATRT